MTEQRLSSDAGCPNKSRMVEFNLHEWPSQIFPREKINPGDLSLWRIRKKKAFDPRHGKACSPDPLVYGYMYTSFPPVVGEEEKFHVFMWSM